MATGCAADDRSEGLTGAAGGRVFCKPGYSGLLHAKRATMKDATASSRSGSGVDSSSSVSSERRAKAKRARANDAKELTAARVYVSELELRNLVLVKTINELTTAAHVQDKLAKIEDCLAQIHTVVCAAPPCTPVKRSLQLTSPPTAATSAEFFELSSECGTVIPDGWISGTHCNSGYSSPTFALFHSALDRSLDPELDHRLAENATSPLSAPADLSPPLIVGPCKPEVPPELSLCPDCAPTPALNSDCSPPQLAPDGVDDVAVRKLRFSDASVSVEAPEVAKVEVGEVTQDTQQFDGAASADAPESAEAASVDTPEVPPPAADFRCQDCTPDAMLPLDDICQKVEERLCASCNSLYAGLIVDWKGSLSYVLQSIRAEPGAAEKLTTLLHSSDEALQKVLKMVFSQAKEVHEVDPETAIAQFVSYLLTELRSVSFSDGDISDNMFDDLASDLRGMPPLMAHDKMAKVRSLKIAGIFALLGMKCPPPQVKQWEAKGWHSPSPSPKRTSKKKKKGR